MWCELYGGKNGSMENDECSDVRGKEKSCFHEYLDKDKYIQYT